MTLIRIKVNKKSRGSLFCLIFIDKAGNLIIILPVSGINPNFLGGKTGC